MYSNASLWEYNIPRRKQLPRSDICSFGGSLCFGFDFAKYEHQSFVARDRNTEMWRKTILQKREEVLDPHFDVCTCDVWWFAFISMWCVCACVLKHQIIYQSYREREERFWREKNRGTWTVGVIMTHDDSSQRIRNHLQNILSNQREMSVVLPDGVYLITRTERESERERKRGRCSNKKARLERDMGVCVCASM